MLDIITLEIKSRWLTAELTRHPKPRIPISNLPQGRVQ